MTEPTPGAPRGHVAGLTPQDYWSPERFQKEQAALARRAWHPVGLVCDLPNSNDFITAFIGGHSVIIQNFKGQLRAFENVCTHRGSEIRCERQGNGPLRCPYHGWTFDADGAPVGIPHRETFGPLDEAALKNLALKRWRLEACGQFLFASDTSNPVRLMDELGDVAAELLRISDALGRQVDRTELTVRANWKIAVENTLENYHVDLIHPTTFRTLGASGTTFELRGRHSAWNGELAAPVVESWKRFEKNFADRPMKLDGYRHLFVFPSLTIASTFGGSFSLQTFEAMEPGVTRFTTRAFLSKLGAETRATRMAQDVLASSVVDFNRHVFEEDRVICERVHRGVIHAEAFGPLSALEGRVAEFQRACATLIQSGAIEPALPHVKESS